jgi:hypothetical protein
MSSQTTWQCVWSAFVITFVVAIVWNGATVLADPCTFPANTQNGLWVGLPSQITACLNAIPFNVNIRDQTIPVLQNVVTLYSYTDIATNAPPPYHIQVDLFAQLNRISTTTYARDFDFHLDVANVFMALQDGHTVYFTPGGYAQFYVIRPFGLMSSVQNGQQIITARVGPLSASTYATFAGSQYNLNNYYNRRILQINGVDALNYTINVANSFGFMRDPAIRFNFALFDSSPWEWGPLAYSPVGPDNDTYLFDGDSSPVTFPNLGVSATAWQNINQLQQANNFVPPTKKRDVGGLWNTSLEDSRYDQFREYLMSTYSHLNLAETLKQSREFLFEKSDVVKSLDQHKKWRAHSVFHERFQEKLKMMKMLLREARPTTDYVPLAERKELRLAADTSKLTHPTDNSRVPHHVVGQLAPQSAQRPIPPIVDVTPNTGNPAQLQVMLATSAGDAFYMIYENTVILKMTTFEPKDQNAFMTVFETTITDTRDRTQNGKVNLIIDLLGNGGGSICLMYYTLSFLVQDWERGSLSGPTNLYMPYDFRQSSMTDQLLNIGYVTNSDYIDINTKQVFTTDVWYTDGPNLTRGNRTSKYTEKAFWNVCASVFAAINYSFQFWFDKAIIITDGLCASACSYFATKMQLAGKAKVVTLGGLRGQPIDISSVNGGNVLDYPQFVADVQQGGYILPDPPTSATISFNFHEMYTNTDINALPREFIALSPDWNMDFWLPLYDNSPATTTGAQNLADLYQATLPLFAQVPSGQLGVNPPLTPLGIALVVIACIIFVVIVVVVVVVVVRKRC